MILIYPDGTLISGNSWLRSRGIIVHDPDNPYKMDFAIALSYTEKQREQWKRILELKNLLSATDYQTNKYIEDEYSEAEWEAKKAQRAAWRDEIREIRKTFVEPTITLEEMREAERRAIEKLNAPNEAKEQNQII